MSVEASSVHPTTTTCRHGHDLTTDDALDTNRRCRVCKRARDRRYRATDKGRASRVAHERTPKARARKFRYEHSTKGQRRAFYGGLAAAQRRHAAALHEFSEAARKAS